MLRRQLHTRGRHSFDGLYVCQYIVNTLEVEEIYLPTLEPGVPYNVSVRAMNGAPHSGVDTVIIAYVAPRRKLSSYVVLFPPTNEWMIK